MTAVRRGTNLVFGSALLFILYSGTAQLGFILGAVAGFAALVWPPTGIALAALRLFGFSLWPGVFAGALLVNLVHGAPFLVACGSASGNTLEALLGAWLLAGVRFQPRLERVLDVLALIFFAAIASTAVSAFAGVGSLWLGGIIPSAETGRALRAWWIGDALGDLVVAPLLFLFRARPPLRRLRATVVEAVLLACALVVFGVLIFGNALDGLVLYRQPYLLFPPLAWA